MATSKPTHRPKSPKSLRLGTSAAPAKRQRSHKQTSSANEAPHAGVEVREAGLADDTPNSWSKSEDTDSFDARHRQRLADEKSICLLSKFFNLRTEHPLITSRTSPASSTNIKSPTWQLTSRNSSCSRIMCPRQTVLPGTLAVISEAMTD